MCILNFSWLPFSDFATFMPPVPLIFNAYTPCQLSCITCIPIQSTLNFSEVPSYKHTNLFDQLIWISLLTVWQLISWIFSHVLTERFQHKTKSTVGKQNAKIFLPSVRRSCDFMKITPLQNFIAISSRCGDDYTWFDGEDMFTFWQLVSEPISSTDDVVSPPPLVNRSKC